MSCWMREIERWTVSPAEQAEFDAGEGTNRASHWKETTDLSQRNELSEAVEVRVYVRRLSCTIQGRRFPVCKGQGSRCSG